MATLSFPLPGPMAADAECTCPVRRAAEGPGEGGALASREHVVRLLLKVKAQELLLELAGEPGAAALKAQEIVVQGGLGVRIEIGPAERMRALQAAIPPGAGGRYDAPRSACERDLLELLARMGASASKRFTRPQILGEMDRQNILHGESTVNNALCRLVKVGLLVNDHDRRGYGLPATSASPPS